MADEVFGRRNRISTITFKQGSATGHKSINPGCITNTNFILLYCKDRDDWVPNRIFTERSRNTRYNQFIPNRAQHYSKWKIIPLSRAFSNAMGLDIREARQLPDLENQLAEFVFQNAESVIQLARPDYKGVSKDAKKMIDVSKNNPERIYHLEREGYSDMYFIRGERIIFYKDTLKEIDGNLVPGEPLTTLWDDIPSHNLHNEGGVDFPKGKKPEALIKRCFELTTSIGDLVLDSFLGSGTTAAVAHKMGRRWIGIELGEHCHTHCIPRLQKVVDGTDQGGISEAVSWKGGGGFKFYNLAPSLLKKDKYGNFVIDENYNANMLAAAMAKHQGFKYQPDAEIYWKQGQSTERDFIFTTTQFVTVKLLDQIQQEMKPEESLLVCCKSFQKACENKFPSITIKKIPKMLLGRCEFEKNDYSLNIISMPQDPNAPEFVPVGPEKKPEPVKKKRKPIAQMDLLD